MEAVQRAILAGQVSNFELQLAGGEGSVTFVRVHVSPIRRQDPWEPCAVLALEDITAYKQVGLSGRAHENARRYAEVLQLATQLERQKEHYRLQSIHDGLTGLYNYAHFQALLAHEIARAQRYEHPVALLMIDIDDFKTYNDTYGHPAGNWALRDVATILQHACRQTDWVARYGGEEFTVILPETDMAGALVVADRLRRAVERESQIGLWFRRPVTISIGVAVYPHDGNTPQELILRADERLYQAKAAGKNRVQGVEEISTAS
jgi:diguanylate cyclase (GGDEF)-like protein